MQIVRETTESQTEAVIKRYKVRAPRLMDQLVWWYEDFNDLHKRHRNPLSE